MTLRTFRCRPVHLVVVTGRDVAYEAWGPVQVRAAAGVAITSNGGVMDSVLSATPALDVRTTVRFQLDSVRAALSLSFQR